MEKVCIPFYISEPFRLMDIEGYFVFNEHLYRKRTDRLGIQSHALVSHSICGSTIHLIENIYYRPKKEYQSIKYIINKKYQTTIIDFCLLPN